MKDIGFLGIEFEDELNEDAVQELITEFYKANNNKIKTMWYLQIADKSSLKDVHNHIEQEYSKR